LHLLPRLFVVVSLWMKGGRNMKGIRFVMVVVALALIVVLATGGAGQTQAPEVDDPVAERIGTAGTGEEDSRTLTGAAVQPVEDQPRAVDSYNASLRIPAAALKPRTSDVEWMVGGEGGCVYASSGDQYTWWAAPLYLPDGATIRFFRMYYNDQNETHDCEAWLTVYDLYGRVEVEWGIESRLTGMSYITSSELDHVVDYNYYNYVIHWRPEELGSDMQVCGFRVYYEYTWGLAYLPIVTKGD
jgi:hypothetical protein